MSIRQRWMGGDPISRCQRAFRAPSIRQRVALGSDPGSDRASRWGREHAGGQSVRQAGRFKRAWNYDFFWSTLIGRGEFGELQTDMGHAEYAAGGVDRRDTVHCPFTDPEEVLEFDPWEALGEEQGLS